MEGLWESEDTVACTGSVVTDQYLMGNGTNCFGLSALTDLIES